MARREFPEAPIVGVGAVILDGQRVLLVRRGQEPLKGEWSIPGGALELGERLANGLRREVAEETGLEVRVLGIVEVLEKIVLDESAARSMTATPVNAEPGGQVGGEPAGVIRPPSRVRFHYVLIDFLCVATGGSLTCGTDAAEARWALLEDLESDGLYQVAPVTVSVIGKALEMSKSLAWGLGEGAWAGKSF